MSRIFLSYRRQDSAGVAGRIFDRLRAHFGEGAIFMDIDTIPFGEDFREHIDNAVAQCDVVLAVIGPRWLGKSKKSRRIDDPRDFVRIELESALERGIPVIPILIDRTPMPAEADLPSSLALLAWRNAIEVDQGRDFHPHVDRLVRGIEFHFGRSKAVAVDPTPTREWTNSIGMKLVRIEPGEFPMGTTKDQVDQLMQLFPESQRAWYDNEQPEHPVKISRPFYLGIHQVTQGQYQMVFANAPSHFKGSDDLPVERVSWLDAVGFCNELSKREKRTPFYRIDGGSVTIVGGNGYRLPNEAEWEYACRANSATLYPFGDDAGKLGEYAWYDSNSERKTHPVGQKRPNGWGLYDMLGNVYEWCADGYEEEYYASSPSSDPPGASGASRRVFRGGGWGDDPGYCRPAYRVRFTPGDRDYDLGFRVAAAQE